MKLNSEFKEILEYIVSGQTDRLQQSEWVNIANKLLSTVPEKGIEDKMLNDLKKSEEKRSPSLDGLEEIDLRLDYEPEVWLKLLFLKVNEIINYLKSK